MKTNIYILKDPNITDDLLSIRYVGKSNNPVKRLSKHIRDCINRPSNTHKENWIRQLLDSGVTPILEVIENSIEVDKWKELEIYHIENYKKLGCNLTNSTVGGDNCCSNSQKKVAKIDWITNDVIEIYDSIADAAYYNNMKSTSRISYCCNGKTLKSYGYVWRYVNDNKIIDIKLDHDFRNKKIGQFDLEFNLIKIYTCLYNIDFPNISNIHKVCNGIYKTAYGHIWRFLTPEKNEIIEPEIKYKNKTVSQWTLNDEYVKTFESAYDAGKELNVSGDCIMNCCKGKQNTSVGFKWKFNKF